MAIEQTLINELEDLCQCGFTHVYIDDSNLLCFSATEDVAVTFRARITETPTASLIDLTSHLLQILETTETMDIWGTRLKMDETCAVRISSLEDPECALSGKETDSSTGDYCTTCKVLCSTTH